MRIDELELRSFGPFTGLTLVFPAHDGDFHVLYGRNEAGKSSALRALKSFFFGIPHQSTDNFLHDSTKLRICGHLRSSDGSRISLLRKKGTKNTLLDLNENPLDESVLRRFLPGISEEMFETFFGISHDTLAKGGQSILNEGGDVGQSLFTAGMGGVDLRAVLRDFNSEADSLFRPRGQNQLINRAISEYAEIKKALQDASLPGRKWSEHTGELKKALSDQADLTKKIENARHEKSRLNRMHQALSDVALREKRLAELLELGEVVVVDDGFGKTRRGYLDRLRTANDARERSAAAIERLNEDMGTIVISREVLDQAAAISDLHLRLGSHRKGLLDLGGLTGNMQQLSQDIEILASEIGTTVSDRPKAALRARIQDLGGKHQALLDALARSDKDIRKTEVALAKAMEELQSLSAPRSIYALKSAVSRIQKQGDLTLALEDATSNLHAEEEQIALDLDRLPLWSGAIGELEKIAVPSPETIERFESLFQEIARKTIALDEKEREVRADLEATGLKMKTLHMAVAVPSENDLSQARERRGLGWNLVLRSWIEKEAIEEESLAFDSEDALPKAYEKTVIHADEVADRLRREADRVAQYAALAARQAAISENLLDMEKSRRDLTGQLLALEREWREQWELAGIMPLSPKEMRSWVTRQSAILQKADKTRELRRTCGQTAMRIKEHSAALTTCLHDLDRQLPADMAFDAILTECQSVIESVEAVNRRRTDLEKKVQELGDDLKAFHQSHEILEQNHKSWQSDWKTAVSRLGLESDTLPAEAHAVLLKLEEFFKKTDERDSIERRVSGINRDAEEFQAEVKSLVVKIAPELSDVPVDQAVTQLNALLGKAKTDSARLTDMENRLREQEETLREAEETIRVELKHLESLCAQTGCTHYEDLEEIEIKSSRKKSIQNEIDSTEARLLKIGGGMSIGKLVEEVKGVDADSLPGTISEIENQLAELEAKRSDLDQSLGGMQAILAQMDGSAKAAEAAEKSQQVLSSMRENVERYVRLRMSSVMLSREIERYRSENQDPLIRRASRIFSDLTLQSFLKLETDFNEKDEPVIVGIRPSGEKIGVQGMSDGTRDQLYLALRVASLEKYLDTNEPVPFIVDDILIRFDDERAMAALNVLADLSRKTQVLFLTHHARLAELVQKESFCGNSQIHFLP